MESGDKCFKIPFKKKSTLTITFK